MKRVTVLTVILVVVLWCEALADEPAWKYANTGSPMPTPESLLSEGYKCINCSNPRQRQNFTNSPDVIVLIKAFKKDSHGVVLYELPNKLVYGFQEVHIVTKSSKWAYDEKNTKIVSITFSNVNHEYDIDLKKYGL